MPALRELICLIIIMRIQPNVARDVWRLLECLLLRFAVKQVNLVPDTNFLAIWRANGSRKLLFRKSIRAVANFTRSAVWSSPVSSGFFLLLPYFVPLTRFCRISSGNSSLPDVSNHNNQGHHQTDVSTFMAAVEADAAERAQRRVAQRTRAGKLKDRANVFFKAGDCRRAIELYTQGIGLAKDWEVLYTNRAQVSSFVVWMGTRIS